MSDHVVLSSLITARELARQRPQKHKVIVRLKSEIKESELNTIFRDDRWHDASFIEVAKALGLT